MCRPLKDIVAELEAKYERSELLYDLEERRRIIEDFDKNVDYMFVRLKQFEEDVKFVLNNKLSVDIIRRITLNLTHIMQYMCESICTYFYVIEFYLLNECYEKNYDMWSQFVDYRHNINSLAENLKENNIYEINIPSLIDVLIKMSFDDDSYNSGEKVTPSGMLMHRFDEINKMNGFELFIVLDQLMDVFETNLDELKIASHKCDNESMTRFYNLNYLLYAKKYWPIQANNFRAHITRQRLRGNVSIADLEKLRDETAHEFEYHTEPGKIWRDYSEDKVQLGVQMKERKLDEEQWRYFFKTIFELEEFDRWIEELRNPPESNEDIQKRVRLLQSNKIFKLEKTSSRKEVDILRLFKFIETRFISEKMFVYEWYALFHFCKRINIVGTCTTEDFVSQMNDKEWFPDVKKKCTANEINTYNFLNDKSPDIWDKNLIPGGSRAKKKSIENIHRKYIDLEDNIDEIYVKE